MVKNQLYYKIILPQQQPQVKSEFLYFSHFSRTMYSDELLAVGGTTHFVQRTL